MQHPGENDLAGLLKFFASQGRAGCKGDGMTRINAVETKLSHFIAVAGVATVVLFTLPASADAQWLKYKTPGIPRTADGKPDLSAPAPRTADGKPDLSGLWRPDAAGAAETGKAMGSLKPQPWAAALAQKRQEDLFKDSPGIQCLPPGPLVGMGVGKVVQTPDLLLMLFSGTLYREVFLDGRELPKDPNPSWMGYSVGHWEGDTLVVESAGFNDRTWIDNDGHPHTEALHVIERLRRPSFGKLEILETLNDPGAFVESWTVPLKFEFDADTESLEYVCNENERDRQHLVGKASDEKGIQLAPAILSKYAGSYELKIPGREQIQVMTVSMAGDRLMLGGLGPNTPLTPRSETEFSAPFGHISFVKDDQGAITHLILQIVEGDLKAVRK
jgi:hypothetical protein